MKVAGKPVIPVGGHRLVAAPSKKCKLAFVAGAIACCAGKRATALLQLQDAHGNSLQVQAPLSQTVVHSSPTSSYSERGIHSRRLSFHLTSSRNLEASVLVAEQTSPGVSKPRSDVMVTCRAKTCERGMELILCAFMRQAGGDVVSAALIPKDAQSDARPGVEVTDRGTGLYELHFTITQVRCPPPSADAGLLLTSKPAKGSAEQGFPR